MKKVKILRRIMLFWTLFIGIGAVAGAIGMLTAPDGSNLGMQELLPYFQVLPFAELLFQDYVFPGIALLVVNGLTNLLAAFFIFKKKKAGAYLGCTFGFTLMLWIIIQFIILPANFLSTIYFFFGLAQYVCGFIYIVSIRQANFYFNENDYKNIGRGGDELVVYYSRLNYAKKVAYERADETGADIYEVRTPERTAGTLGFLWCGRFGMHGWAMPIDEITVDVSRYRKVTIVTPIWVFSVAGPIRAFCEKCRGKIKAADYISVHFRKDSDFRGAFSVMDELLGIKAENHASVVCKFGNVIKRWDFKKKL